jgi:hypothetical protein
MYWPIRSWYKQQFQQENGLLAQPYTHTFDSSKTVRFEMLMVVNMKIIVFLDVTPAGVVHKFQHFERILCLLLQAFPEDGACILSGTFVSISLP